MAYLKKICIVATVPVALRAFMLEHVNKLAETHSITLMANGSEADVAGMLGENVRFLPLPIERQVSLLSDLKSLVKLYRIFSSEKFDCVLSIMPKSGLLSMLAGFFACVPVRVHIFTGQVWFTKKGIARIGLKKLDCLLAFCATSLLADSPSQRDFLVQEKVVRANKIGVLGQGSISGVDVRRFKPSLELRHEIRQSLGIPEGSIVFLFMARLTHVKGVLELGQAFKQLSQQLPHAHLLIVGPDEDGLDVQLSELLKSFGDRFHRIGYTQKPESYMAASDVFCIPSYREGFSLATIQAAGVGLPAIASRIYGLTDAVKEDVTGIFHTAGSVAELSSAILRLYTDAELRLRLSKSAQLRAHQDFSQMYIVQEMHRYITSLLSRVR
ncbi:glycosyltransferase family 4 protein [Pseudomonas veronii]|jgi:glycosyltransferase involved in cell wall biosynthesis|uniref:Glycosyltransferase family 4 protein n=1 Tax=Pseudomonas veronii TaxID=76761 RepID=A0A0R3BLY4_PSEVE|nr:glycosyltransferase family 4 protein [Pseudomonas veronii]SEC10719.1 Glycosyltransferase involved in cell wall bisynthesis [Pseudomonas marginalis]KRP83617.1 glycosyl transferase family 1 [Pseudomonas veronii]NMX96613.1 glycosyltransferase family 4 protein [Pseudomonas veronii]RTY79101.1 glycosyltransferase family 1 protein [Pseudomonas veronii]RWA26322.1 glycosyltransferase family 1 protein [Pseudomonas veronii]